MARPTHIGNTTYGFGRVLVGVGDDPDAPTGDAPTPEDAVPEATVEIPVGVFESAELNVAHGTMTSGQSGAYGPAPANPTNANDEMHDTRSVRASFSGSGGAAIAWWWQTDLGTSYIVTSLEAYDPVSDYDWRTTFTTLVEGSANGTDWTSLAYTMTSGTYANNGVGGGTRDKTIYTLDDPAQYRYWRIRKTHNTSGFETEDATAEIKVYGQEASDLAWIAATLVKDDDDATFEYVTEEAITAAGAILRIDVGTAQRFASFRLVIGLEDAGSVEYTLEGDDADDFAGAVELVSVTFTATGSFTADTVTASWSQATGYRYYRLVPTTPDDVRIYTFSLYPSEDASVHVTDPTDAHDASAISIVDAGTLYAATNVEAALQEIGAHPGDTSDAHDASAISVLDTAAVFTATDVEAALKELYDSISGGGIPATIVDAKGDLIVATAADTVARKAAGANDTILMADSSTGDGLKWVASQTPSTLDYDDAAAEGTADTYARGDHVHGMPSASAGGGGYPLDSYSIDATYGDDFDGAALDAIWTRRNFTSGAETYQLPPGGSYMRIAMTSRAIGDGYFQTAPGGDWTFAMAYINRLWTQHTWSLCVINSVGTGVGVEFADVGGGVHACIVAAITTYSTYGGSFQQTGGTASLQPQFLRNRKVWTYLRKSGTNYYAAFSVDGETWSPETPAFSSAITVDRVGMIVHPQAAITTTAQVDVDWFNKIA